MALTDEGGSPFTMPVAPMYGGGGGFGGFGNGDWAWIILLLLLGWGNNGWGGFGGGMGGFAADGAALYPWMNQAELTNGGFRDQMINNNITGIRDTLSDISTQLCGGFAGVNAGVANGFAQAEIANNARQIADMQQMFSLQSALQSCCCDNKAGLADLKYVVATENCADRQVVSDGIRDVIASSTANTQAILDKLCQLELDGVKAQVDAKNDRIAELQSQLNMASLRESQTAQNAFIAQGLNNEVDALYNRLSNCPVPSVPVFGKQNIFTCGGNGCGCGCNG